MKALLMRIAMVLIWALPLRAEVNVQEVVSPGGLKAWLVEEHSIPFIALEIRFRPGALLDPPGKRGTSNLMMALLEEGSGEMDARAFAEARDSLAASYSFDIGDDAAAVSARFLTENRDQAVALLKQALMQPRFDPDAIERVRAQVLAVIRSAATDPDTIAGQRFDALAWGDHPYGKPLEGTLQSVAAITRDDLIAAHGRIFGRNRLYISAVGDIGAADLGRLLDTLLGDLPELGAADVPPAHYQMGPGVTVVPFETPQSVALFGHEGIARDDPDYIPAYILNHIVGGGGFQSRLMNELREKRGLTYGVSTSLLPMDLGHLILGQLRSDNAKMAQAIELVRKEWRRVAQEGVSQQELDDAKTYLTGAYPLRFDGNAKIARILVGMQMVGLGRDYIRKRNDLVRAVSLEEINRVARRIYRPEALHFVVVGRPEGVSSTSP